MSKKSIEDVSRAQIAHFLPDAIALALTSYHKFSLQTPSGNDAKEFSSHHSACKVAIAHIELLLKLARWAELPDPAAGTHNDQIMLSTLIQKAASEVARYHETVEDEGE